MLGPGPSGRGRGLAPGQPLGLPDGLYGLLEGPTAGHGGRSLGCCREREAKSPVIAPCYRAYHKFKTMTATSTVHANGTYFFNFPSMSIIKARGSYILFNFLH